jgi:hypothetical protein
MALYAASEVGTGSPDPQHRGLGGEDRG